MNYLNKQQKDAYSRPFYDLHDTFSRNIVIFKYPNATLISSQPEYNFLYSEQDNAQVKLTPISGIFPARIKWQNASNANDDKEIRGTIFGNYCRIKIKADALAFISEARGQRIEVDGRPVSWVGSSEIHGLFAGDFYNLYLKESD